jgi:general secretion pathway protein D
MLLFRGIPFAINRLRLAGLTLTVVLGLAQPTDAERIEDSFALNLTNADISVFIQTVSEITGHNFVIDPRVKGKVTVITATPTTPDRIYEIFLSTLQVNGFVAIPTGDVIKIVPDAGASQRATDTGGPMGGDQLVTRIIQVEHISVKQLVTALKPLLPPTAYMSAHPEAKMIVVADSARNIQRMVRIINRIDRASDQDVDIIRLEHADAEELIGTIDRLDSESAQRRQTAGARLATMVADTRSNSVVLSGPPRERSRLRALIARLDIPTDDQRGARVLYLKHAVATDLQKVLKGIGERLLKTSGKSQQPFEVLADDATNAIILSSPPGLMSEMLNVIERLDIPRSQVQVEAIIAEIASGRGAELGLEWQTSVPTDGVYGVFRSDFVGSGSSSLPAGTSASNGFPESAGLGLSLGYFSGGDLRVLLKALASDSTTKILSTPTIVTLDNKQALIHVGKNVPIVTGTFTNTSGSEDPFQTIERRDVGIKLRVTPQINEGNTVRLEIRQEVSNVDPSRDGNDLITNERTIETTVQIDDGEIIALGGLISDDVSEQKAGVPYLSDVPVFGELFTSRRSTLDRRNLVVFLRPTILDRNGRRTAMVEQRYQQMRNLQMNGSGKGQGIAHMPGESAATLPPYPPSPDTPMIALPGSDDDDNGTDSTDDEYEYREYPFFDIE